eukprot:3902675-Rhodomonas_salina.1
MWFLPVLGAQEDGGRPCRARQASRIRTRRGKHPSPPHSSLPKALSFSLPVSLFSLLLPLHPSFAAPLQHALLPPSPGLTWRRQASYALSSLTGAAASVRDGVVAADADAHADRGRQLSLQLWRHAPRHPRAPFLYARLGRCEINPDSALICCSLCAPRVVFPLIPPSSERGCGASSDDGGPRLFAGVTICLRARYAMSGSDIVYGVPV